MGPSQASSFFDPLVRRQGKDDAAAQGVVSLAFDNPPFDCRSQAL
jgi:hypothetical protein